MGDSGKVVVFENTGPSGDNSAAYENFEVGSRFLQVSEQEMSEFEKKNTKKAPQEKLKEMLKFFTTG